MFQKYRKNIFSQNGEDGVISEILERLKLNKNNSWCCEFGAWDGIHGSNTFNLVKHSDYNAVYIEGDKKKYIDFMREVGTHLTVNRMLTFDSVKSRLTREQPLSFLEFNYMILQAYDFLHLNKNYNFHHQL